MKDPPLTAGVGALRLDQPGDGKQIAKMCWEVWLVELDCSQLNAHVFHYAYPNSVLQQKLLIWQALQS